MGTPWRGEYRPLGWKRWLHQGWGTSWHPLGWMISDLQARMMTWHLQAATRAASLWFQDIFCDFVINENMPLVKQHIELFRLTFHIICWLLFHTEVTTTRPVHISIILLTIIKCELTT